MTSRKVPIKALNLPFESTYRLQVFLCSPPSLENLSYFINQKKTFQIRLPKNQLYVLRVSPKTTIQEVLTQTCREKGFDEDKFEICHPGIFLVRIFIPICIYSLWLQLTI